MGWDHKGNGVYYSRSRRVNGKVKREYVPCCVAAMMAELDSLLRLQRDVHREAENALRSSMKADLLELDMMICIVDDAVRIQAERAGYHRHDRGAWRKRRSQNMGNELCRSNEELSVSGGDKIEQLKILISDMKVGDKQLGDVMEKADALMSIPMYLLPTFICLQYESRVDSQDKRSGSMLSRDLAKMRTDLGYEASTTLERLMIDRICCCYAAHYDYEQRMAGLTPANKLFSAYDNHAERLGRRMERAIMVLAQIRRMRLPEIHLNLVDKQLNLVQVPIRNINALGHEEGG